MVVPDGSDTLLTVLIVLELSPFCNSQEILVHPNDTTVCINEEPPPMFTCETRGGVSGWWINGIPFDLLPIDIRRELEESEHITNESSIVLTLTIPSRPEYNGTSVQCRVFTEGSGDHSDNATLLILDPQEYSLSVASDMVSIPIICTNVPFSLDVTDTSSDTLYYTLTDEEILFSTNIILDGEYYTVNSTKPCNLYEFTSLKFHQRRTGYIINVRSVSKPAIKLHKTNTILATFNTLDTDGNGCNYTVSTMDRPFTISKPSLPQEPIELLANRRFSFNVSITNDAGGSAFTTIHFTTFDVQNVQVSTNMAGVIEVTGEFITNSTARGMFIVLESEDGSPDVFRALLRQDSGPLLTSTIDNVPPSTYQVLVYDLEEDLLPNRITAYVLKEKHETELAEVEPNVNGRSAIVTNVTIDREGSKLTIWCEFKTDERSSCVLVYREYGNETLVVKEYHQETTTFPVTVILPEVYSFAIFGKNGSSIDKEPVTSQREFITPSDATNPDEGSKESSEDTTFIHFLIAGLVIATLLIITGVGVAFWLIRKKLLSATITVSDTSEECNNTTTEDGSGRIEDGGGKKTMNPQQEDHNYSHDVQPQNSASMERATNEIIYAALDHAAFAVRLERRANDDKENILKTKENFPGLSVESVMTELRCFARRWKEIAEFVGFDDDLIDEIYTNNETDEECLQNCVEVWISRFKPSHDNLTSIVSYFKNY